MVGGVPPRLIEEAGQVVDGLKPPEPFGDPPGPFLGDPAVAKTVAELVLQASSETGFPGIPVGRGRKSRTRRPSARSSVT